MKDKKMADKSVGKTVAKTEERAIENADTLDKLKALRNNSGEGQKMSWPFTPIIEVDSSKVEEIVKGKKKLVLCDPLFKITTRDEDGKYNNEPFGEEFRGSVLLIRYMVEKKWKENDSTPYWRSFEFDESAFRNEKINIVVTQQKEVLFKGSYKQFKNDFDDDYVLSAIVYTLEQNTDRIVRFKFKGVNRGAFWEYKDLFGTKDSISAHTTLFTINSVADGNKEYNHVVFEDLGMTDSIDTVLVHQAGLVDYFKRLNKEDEEETIKVPDEVFSGNEAKMPEFKD